MGLRYDELEQFALLSDASIVLSRDGQNFIMRSLVEAALQSADLAKAGYTVQGVVGTCPDMVVRAIAEPGCGPLIANATAVFLVDKREARRPIPTVTWLEQIFALEDKRTQV
jgi:hypothetical protein